MKILLAVDGSAASTRAARETIRLFEYGAEPARITLFHADAPLMKAVAIELGPQAAAEYHASNSRYAMKGARAALRRAGVPFVEKAVVADPAPGIVREAKSGKYDLIVMGSHGRTALQSVLLGSVTTKVIAQTEIPVLVVR